MDFFQPYNVHTESMTLMFFFIMSAYFSDYLHQGGKKTASYTFKNLTRITSSPFKLELARACFSKER